MSIVPSLVFLSVLAAPCPAKLLFPVRESQVCSQYSLDYDSSAYLVTDPDNCGKFYSCQRKYNGAFRTNRNESKWIWIAYHMDCPLGTVFDGFGCNEGLVCKEERRWIFGKTVKPEPSSYLESVGQADPPNSTPSHLVNSAVLPNEVTTFQDANKTFLTTSSLDETSSKLLAESKELENTVPISNETESFSVETTTFTVETSTNSNTSFHMEDIEYKVENTSSQVENTPSQVENTSSQGENTSYQGENTSSQVESITSPIENTPFQYENRTFLVENTTIQIENTSFLVRNKLIQKENETFPVENTWFQVENNTSPNENITSPNKNTTSPNENTTHPNENTTSPNENTTSPNENTTSQKDNTKFRIENETMQVEHKTYYIETTTFPGRTVPFQDETTESTGEESSTYEISVEPEGLDMEITTFPVEIAIERRDPDQKFKKYIKLISGNIKYSQNEPKLFKKTIRDIKIKPTQLTKMKKENQKKYRKNTVYETDGLETSFEKYIKLVSSKIYQSR